MRKKNSKVVSQNDKDTVVPHWDPTENIATGCEDFYKSNGGTLELRLDRFTEFARSEPHDKKQLRWNASTNIRGLSWKLSAELNEKNSEQSLKKERFLGLFLYCNTDCKSAMWNCRAKYTLSAVAQKEDAVNVEMYFEHNFCSEGVACGCSHFISIGTLLDPENGFINDDTVILRADVKAETPYKTVWIQAPDAHTKTYEDAFGPINKTQLFSAPTQFQSNFVLVVQGKEVHVQTNLLAIHSQYFNEQFAKHSGSNKAILQNINHEEFIELLCVIYLTCYPITAENVETISKLAFTFKMTELLRQCEVFLMVNCRNFGGVKLFLMAHWYKLEHLQTKCIGEHKTENSLKLLRKEPEYAALDCQIKAELLDKLVEAVTATNRSVTYRKSSLRIRTSLILNNLVSSNSIPSDVTLIVDKNRIPVHKTYLSFYSEFFKAMFMGEFQERTQEEIELEEVNYADMLELLVAIYPTNSPVTEENIDGILKLADRFIMTSVLERCKKTLKCSQNMKASHKLLLAQRYNFSDLQMAYAQQYTSLEDVKKLKAEPEYGSLDLKTRALIFDSITA